MDDFDALVSVISAPLQEAVETTERQMTISLRVMASASGWPARIVTLLRVVERDGQFVPGYPKSIQKEVEDLEYGITGEPNPVLRRFANRSESMATRALTRKLLAS